MEEIKKSSLPIMQPTLSIPDLNNNPSSQRIFIVGGGIVGAALAFYLSKANTNHHIILLDRSLGKSLGSTGHAPGFVGQLNESPVLTRLAQDTVAEYLSIPGGFNTVGGLELASTPAGVEALQSRFEKAHAAGLSAEIISPAEAAALAPDFIDPETITAGLRFASDGTANAQVITSYFAREARGRGVDFLEGDVTGFTMKEEPVSAGEIAAIRTADGDIRLAGCTVILATGIWTSSLTGPGQGRGGSITNLPVPIIPVAHPYTFTPSRPARTGPPYPFVRWPEHHVYARDHGERDGLGSYDHAPLELKPRHTAIGTWPHSFNQVLSEATSHLKNGGDFLVPGRQDDLDQDPFDAKQPFNGIFSVTPDNLPLAGKVSDVGNLWLCAAIWVTTAAGTAKLISSEVLRGGEGGVSAGDEELLRALDPARFQGVEDVVLVAQALERYNNIYNKEAGA